MQNSDNWRPGFRHIAYWLGLSGLTGTQFHIVRVLSCSPLLNMYTYALTLPVLHISAHLFFICGSSQSIMSRLAVMTHLKARDTQGQRFLSVKCCQVLKQVAEGGGRNTFPGNRKLKQTEAQPLLDAAERQNDCMKFLPGFKLGWGWGGAILRSIG